MVGVPIKAWIPSAIIPFTQIHLIMMMMMSGNQRKQRMIIALADHSVMKHWPLQTVPKDYHTPMQLTTAKMTSGSITAPVNWMWDAVILAIHML